MTILQYCNLTKNKKNNLLKNKNIWLKKLIARSFFEIRTVPNFQTGLYRLKMINYYFAREIE